VFPDSHDAAIGPRPIFPAERLVALIEIILCSGFPTQLLLIGLLHGLGMPLLLEGGAFNPTFVFTVSMLDAVLVMALVAGLLRVHRESIREVLIGRRRLLREALVGIMLIPMIFLTVGVIIGLILQFAPQLHNVPRNPLEDMLRNDTDAAIFAVVVMFAGGVREEVQRGFIVHRFGQYLGGGLIGVIVYSVLFGLGHYEQGYDASIATAALGAIWGIVYLRRRSIVAPVISHAGFNLAQVIKYVALR
jgi:membrane protease YdiL (CAAX protease family)